MIQVTQYFQSNRETLSSNPFPDLRPVAKKVEASFDMAQKQKVVIVLGKTGSGKSSLCNVIAGKDHDDKDFPTSGEVTSCTQDINIQKVNFMGEANKPIELVDTIGFDDPGKNDKTDVIAKVIKKQIDHVDTFVIVVNGQNSRLDASLLHMLEMFGEAFTDAFWEHVVIAFTRVPMNKDATLRRQRERQNRSDDDWGRSFLAKVEEMAKVPVRYLFIDALHDPSECGEERRLFVNAMEELFKIISSSKGLKTDKEKQSQFLINSLREEQQRKDDIARTEAARLEDEKREQEKETQKWKVEAERRAEEAKKEREAREEAEKKRVEAEQDRDYLINKTQIADKDRVDAERKRRDEVAAERKRREEAETEAERMRGEAKDALLDKTVAELEKERAEKEKERVEKERERERADKERQQRQNEELKKKALQQSPYEGTSSSRRSTSPKDRKLQMPQSKTNSEMQDEVEQESRIKQNVLETSVRGEFDRTDLEIRFIQAEHKVMQNPIQIFGCGGTPGANCQERTLVLAGAKGRGKSYFLKCLVNYIYGVDVEDNFRFRLPGNDHSTNFRAYRFHNNVLGFILTVIDTPTFQLDTDSRVLEERTIQGIQSFLQNGIDSVDALCLIVNATDEQLADVEKEVFKGLKKYFGREPSVCVIANHCDSGKQPIKKAVDEIMSSKSKFCKFLHLGTFFEERRSDSVAMEDQRFYWRKGCESFKDFFSHLSTLQNPIQRDDFAEAQKMREMKKSKGQTKRANESEHSETNLKLSNREIRDNIKKEARRGQYDLINPEIFLIRTDARDMYEDSSPLVQISDCGLSDSKMNPSIAKLRMKKAKLYFSWEQLAEEKLSF